MNFLLVSTNNTNQSSFPKLRVAAIFCVFREMSNIVFFGEKPALLFQVALLLDISENYPFSIIGYLETFENKSSNLSITEFYTGKMLQKPSDPMSINFLSTQRKFERKFHLPAICGIQSRKDIKLKNQVLRINFYASERKGKDLLHIYEKLIAAGDTKKVGNRVVGYEIEAEIALLNQYQNKISCNSKECLSPIAVYFHGGGMVFLDHKAYDKLIRRHANLFDPNIIVLSIDYRLAPEHPFPAALEDCISTLDWLFLEGRNLGLDTSRIVIFGDSAGGSLVASAISVGLLDSEKHPWISSIKAIGLIYPSLCSTCITYSPIIYNNIGLPNHRTSMWWNFMVQNLSTIALMFTTLLKFATSLCSLNSFFTCVAAKIQQANIHTLLLHIYRSIQVEPNSDWRNDPFLIPDVILQRFPPTYFVLFKHDILYDIGLLFHEKLRKCGIYTGLFSAPGMHGFYGNQLFSRYGIAAVEWMSDRLNSHLKSANFVE
ncbi:alpha/beta hydrolase fold domain-containing protein [Cardiosporidium cionae]|uniref:Alpha/beta hydrolase fold domain-containing protein n=1 Tax=Cardiosporidium cionae TaxID=476202 RepID=A0ABQ7JAC7_9APIC|nr:alpha/beta hydrolase fold domain-containing protein [Cardiosporidium cionae]|eukprot:KAF8820936.1 alpha/beta hydrolase fold domain-containing protein [Cardiosporidium cionae]